MNFLIAVIVKLSQLEYTIRPRESIANSMTFNERTVNFDVKHETFDNQYKTNPIRKASIELQNLKEHRDIDLPEGKNN